MNRNGLFINRPAADDPPLGTPDQQDLLRAKLRAMKWASWVTFMIAGLVFMGVASTAIRGELQLADLRWTLPTLAAVLIAVRGIRRQSLALCLAAPAMLFGCGALINLFT